MKLYLLVILIIYGFSYASGLPKILSFGGNGMIGSAVLTRLISSKLYNITLISRGHWHYDSAIRIKPYVHAIVCDRNKIPKCDNCSINALSHCNELMQVINETDEFEAVLDFSAFEPKWVHDAIDVLKSVTVKVYIYISSDAVYEVSNPKGSKRLSVEEDAVRPADVKIRQNLAKQDPYGHAKLAGEEALKDQSHFPWVVFRYADVIGSRDVTRRFAFYHTWLLFFDHINIKFHIPSKIEDVKESITYVEDAADMIVKVLEKGDAVWNEAYNIAMTPPLHTLRSIIQEMAEIMNVTLGETEPSDNNLFMYPTVFSGGIDTQKARDRLGFTPTEFSIALRSTVKWYDLEFVQNYDYREEMVADVMARIIPKERRDKVYLAIDQKLSEAGVQVSNAKRKGDIEHLEKFDKTSYKPPKNEL